VEEDEIRTKIMPDKTPNQQNPIIKPVGDYLINGPIPPEDLAYLDFVAEPTELDRILTVHFMLETISVHGAPKWWKGSISEFEKEFHERYQRMMFDIDKNSELVWNAGRAEVQARRLASLPDEGETKEQVETYLTQGLKRLRQTFAVELLLEMWEEGSER
jgi:hypothetical protein